MRSNPGLPSEQTLAGIPYRPESRLSGVATNAAIIAVLMRSTRAAPRLIATCAAHAILSLELFSALGWFVPSQVSRGEIIERRLSSRGRKQIVAATAAQNFDSFFRCSECGDRLSLIIN